VRIRRRRLGAGVVALAVLVLLIALLSGSHARTTTSTVAGTPNSAVRAHSRTPTDPERDERAAVASVLAYTPFVRMGGGRARDVALTFDDGPGPYTPGVLSVLEKMHVRATFFVIGRMLRYFGSSTVREIEDGDVIGDHTENHPMLAQMSQHEQHEELFEQILRVEALGGHRPVLFRPPYGSFNATTFRELHALRLLMVLWSADTGDYQLPGVEAIVQRALAAAQPGAIILMHDGGGDRSETIAALPQIISGLRKRGLNIVTVPRLLLDDPPPANQPAPTSLSGD
jgi:peptidoglycan/xylan/chitin deacetylase (PgdA/CDA1 family)